MQELYDTGALNLNKIVFGSDAFFGRETTMPGWAFRTLKFELDAIGATEEEKEAVSWRTAARLLGLDE
jgi:predicted TIM-barrel fold metal-dependent hydrolase